MSHHHLSDETSGLSSLEGVLSGGSTSMRLCVPSRVSPTTPGGTGDVSAGWSWLGRSCAARVLCWVGFEGSDARLDCVWGARAAHPLSHAPPPQLCCCSSCLHLGPGGSAWRWWRRIM